MPSRRTLNNYAKHGRIFKVTAHAKRRLEQSNTIIVLALTFTGVVLTFLLAGSELFHS
ncbi:hypothetical protein H8S90_14255 [Olivibacter sp. SDN3]|uniref:hypothetical protein n=1 Tax=Olivibacter sp. SDN3 TaxID=2764720 RepID=UPI0016511FD6|nr:hypothetical protein [Olivibacter sp. SDN3]QNL47973.1 hypothetical protein H8S90_14255 [Olivibacter sp. SDN3]